MEHKTGCRCFGWSSLVVWQDHRTTPELSFPVMCGCPCAEEEIPELHSLKEPGSRNDCSWIGAAYPPIVTDLEDGLGEISFSVLDSGPHWEQGNIFPYMNLD